MLWEAPLGGGGYLRLLPYAFTKRALCPVAGSGRPIIIYLHPHEFDPARLRLDHTPKLGRLHLFELLQNINRGIVATRRTEALLSEFPVGPLREVAESWPKT